MEHGCVAESPATLVGNRKRGMCVYFIVLLLSLNGPFEGDDGSQQVLRGRTVCGHLNSNLTIRYFFGGCTGVSGEVGFGLASKLWFPQRLKAPIVGGRALRRKAVTGDPLLFPHRAACRDVFWVEFHHSYF